MMRHAPRLAAPMYTGPVVDTVTVLANGASLAAHALVSALGCTKPVVVGKIVEHHADWPTRVRAAALLIERAYGKAVQPIVTHKIEGAEMEARLAALSADELEMFKALRAKMKEWKAHEAPPLLDEKASGEDPTRRNPPGNSTHTDVTQCVKEPSGPIGDE